MLHDWMIALSPYLSLKNPVTILWLVRVGIVILLTGLFWPNMERRYMLRRLLQIRHEGASNNKFTLYLESLTYLPAFRWFALKENSDDYIKLEGMIKKAGGLNGITPNVIQLFRVMLPPIFFVIATLVYLVNVRMSYLAYQASLMNPQSGSGSNLMAIVPHTVQLQAPTVNWVAIMWIAVGSFILYMAPPRFVTSVINAREKQMDSEIHVAEQFIKTLLESKMTVFEIMQILRDTTTLMKPYLSHCVNEFHAVGPERALTNLGERVNNDEFKIVCNVLKQAATNTQEYTLPFLDQHIRQFEQIRQLAEERKIRMKPMIYTLILGMPLAGVVVIYFYPYLTKAITMLHSF